MSTRLNVVVVSGSTQQPSETDVLLSAVAGELGTVRPIDTTVVRLVNLQPELGSAIQRPPASHQLGEAIDAVEGADLLLVGTPVCRGTYSGLLKTLFDLLAQETLRGKPVLLAATGDSERHALILEHHLRPLLAFFKVQALPLSVYGTNRDFAQGRLCSAPLTARIKLAVRYALPWLGHYEPVHATSQSNPHAKAGALDFR